MTSKFVLGAIAVVGAMALTASAYAAEVVVVKPMHHRHHHRVIVVKPAPKPMMAKPVVVKKVIVVHHRGGMGIDAKERAETARLNEQQVMMGGVQK